MKHILKCGNCSEYTMKEECPKCSAKALNPIPPKYSIEDKMGKYRRMAKKENLVERGLL